MKLKKVVNLFLFTSILGFSVASCNNDDDGPTPPDYSKLVGTWGFKNSIADVQASDSILTDSITHYIDTIRVATKQTFLFKIDGTYENNTGIDGAQVITGKYQVNDGIVKMEGQPDSTITYTFASDTLKRISDVKNRAARDLVITSDSIKKALKVEIFTKTAGV